MIGPNFRRALQICRIAGLQVVWLSLAHAQASGPVEQSPVRPVKAGMKEGLDAEHVQLRSAWFLHGRVVPGKSTAELRRHAFETKMQIRVRAARLAPLVPAGNKPSIAQPAAASGWTALGPVPLASDATGDGFQNYHQVSGRATAVTIDPADPSGNTLYIGGAQGGVWKSTNAAASVASNVTWTPLTDDQATLSVGSIAIQPGNTNPSQSVILVGTGEADSAADSYFGLGILRSADGGNSWTLISTANGGALSFSGLGGTGMAFSTATGQTSTVVASMGATSEGIVEGALTPNSNRGLYTSSDAGQTWTYDAVLAGGASQSTSATSVVYNAAAGLFFAALRYHGFYSSPDGLNWTALAVQPGAPGLLSAAACPQNYATDCPIYRAEISVVPGRNEMYVWFISLDSNGNPVDQGIWQSPNGGASWAQILDGGIINCGDLNGCGVEQGFYNLALLALPDGEGTDLYAGAINLYKCSISSVNPACANAPFLNLTHAYGCDPLGAPAHVHPDQHGLAYALTGATDLMYFANDGGVYRALDGFTGLTTGSCSGTNLFDDLNQNLGSMTQFVAFSEHPTNVDMLLGGSQDNGSPATATATSHSSWENVLSGDGGFNAIDGNTGNWFASNPDTGSGGLAIQQCSSGVSCTDSLFSVVVSSANLSGDDGGFYFPYILDPQSASSMLVGTCRVWSGPRTGGAFTELSLNFDTLGLGTCAGTEINVIRALAAGGSANANGSEVIYATTDGLGPNNSSAPIGGNVWVTSNASAVSGTISNFTNVTLNGPGGASLNPNQFPISGVAIDASDPTGNTAYVTVMGFTGGPGHVWQTTNGGNSWRDWTNYGGSAVLPDSPTNAVVVDPGAHMVYVGTDVGVFGSSTLNAAWTEVGPIPSTSGGVSGFLPDVAVTALGIFNSGTAKLLRASTYGRGIWQFNLLAQPDFQIAVSNTPQTVFVGGTANFNGTLTAVNGYNNFVQLSCISGSTSPPAPCTVTPATLVPAAPPAYFTVTSNGTSAVTDYSFSVQGLGLDPKGTTHKAPLNLNIVNWSISAATPGTVIEPVGSASPPVSFVITPQGNFGELVALACGFPAQITGSCTFTPGVTFPVSSKPQIVSASVTTPANTPAGPYAVAVTATSSPDTSRLSTSFTVNVGANFGLKLTANSFPNVKAGSSGMAGAVTIAAEDGFSGNVALSCTATPNNTCSILPASVGVPGTATLTINGGTLNAGNYQASVLGASGMLTNSLIVPFIVEDYGIAGPSALVTTPGSPVSANLTLTSQDFYIGTIDLECDASALANAQCAFNPLSPIAIGSGAVVDVTANLTVPNNAAAGTYNINFNTHDMAGAPIHNWTTALSVQDFAFGAVAPQTIGSGYSATYNLEVAPVGASFGGVVSFSCPTTQLSLTCSFTPDSIIPGNDGASVALTIASTAAATPGDSSVIVVGTSGSLSHSVAVPITVANSFHAAVISQFPSVEPNQVVTATIAISANYIGAIEVSCVDPANSLTTCGSPSAVKVSKSAVTAVITLTVPTNANPGTYNLTVNLQGSGAMPQSLALPFTVPQDFSISISPQNSQTITAGQSITYSVSVLPVGNAFNGTITLQCTSFPTLQGTCAASPTSVGPLSASTSAAATVTVTTTAASAQSLRPGGKDGNRTASLALAFFAILVLSKRSRRRARVFALLGLWLTLPSCGGNGGGGTIGTQGTPVIYTIRVTGTSGALINNAPPVTLVVN
jgi:hypothetical protein